MSPILKALAIGLWLGVLALTLGIVIDYAGTGGRIAAGVAIAAIAVSACGGLLVSRCWATGRRGAAAMALFAVALGEGYLAPIEIGYWASQVRQRADDRDLAELKRAGDLAELRAKQAASWKETMQSPEELRAERAAELAQSFSYVNEKGYAGPPKTLGEWTAECTNESHWAYRAGKCSRYIALNAELERSLAAARAREGLGRQIIQLPPDPRAGAKWFEHRLGLLSAETWSETFTLIGVLFLMVLRCCTLAVAAEIGRPPAGDRQPPFGQCEESQIFMSAIVSPPSRPDAQPAAGGRPPEIGAGTRLHAKMAAKQAEEDLVSKALAVISATEEDVSIRMLAECLDISRHTAKRVLRSAKLRRSA